MPYTHVYVVCVCDGMCAWTPSVRVGVCVCVYAHAFAAFNLQFDVEQPLQFTSRRNTRIQQLSCLAN